jgi:hypothetical protein
MVLADDVAAMLVALLIVRIEPVAGRRVTFDAGTWVYPLKFRTGNGAVTADAKGLGVAPEEALAEAAEPEPPVSK